MSTPEIEAERRTRSEDHRSPRLTRQMRQMLIGRLPAAEPPRQIAWKAKPCGPLPADIPAARSRYCVFRRGNRRGASPCRLAAVTIGRHASGRESSSRKYRVRNRDHFSGSWLNHRLSSVLGPTSCSHAVACNFSLERHGATSARQGIECRPSRDHQRRAGEASLADTMGQDQRTPDHLSRLDRST